jgi:hypothetical protein
MCPHASQQNQSRTAGDSVSARSAVHRGQRSAGECFEYIPFSLAAADRQMNRLKGGAAPWTLFVGVVGCLPDGQGRAGGVL